MIDKTVVYAIADTHLGLRRRLGENHSDSPDRVGDFLHWLAALPPEGEKLRVLEHGSVNGRLLLPATKLVLLGDILELWDAENPAILLSSLVGTVLERIDAEKIYVVGNHDIILGAQQGSYPLGDSKLRIVGEVYPEPDEKIGTRPLHLGPQAFLFVHGHQFDPIFVRSGGAWRLLSYIRQFGTALGVYAWLFFGLWLAVLLLRFLMPSLLDLSLALALPLLWFPRLYLVLGRVLYARGGRRYNRPGALKGFQSWWAGFNSQVEEAANLGIVYGHTHLLDWFEAGPTPRKATELTRPIRKRTKVEVIQMKAETRLNTFLRKVPKKPQTLYNISSWVSVSPEDKHAPVIWATSFYADDQGPLILGWDWNLQHPFHIPFEFIVKRRLQQKLDSSEELAARSLGWPRELVQKWQDTKEEI
jgi:UDP-2,3-diacylglucosamine pyrophosphatase LpxH